jgi:hypothetical protein
VNVLASALVAASAVVVLSLGLIHLLYTFHGTKLHPRDPQLTAALKEASPVLTRRTTMWKAWGRLQCEPQLRRDPVRGCLRLSGDRAQCVSLPVPVPPWAGAAVARGLCDSGQALLVQRSIAWHRPGDAALSRWSPCRVGLTLADLPDSPRRLCARSRGLDRLGRLSSVASGV